MDYNYGKRPLWQWVLIYVVAAIIIYGAVYYFFLRNNSTYNYNPPASSTNTPTTTGNITINTTASDTVKIGTSAAVSQFLTDNKGMTLYYYTKDTQNSGKSTCYGSCETLWPVFSTDNIALSSPLTANDFSVVTRTDGKKQLAYKGWPLYYYSKDTAVGDVNGEGVGGVWFAMRP